MSPTTPSVPRFPDEVARLAIEEELNYLLGPLAARCDELEAAPVLSAADGLLLDQLTAFIGAVGRYGQTTDTLLASYAQALERAERPAPAPVPTLEQALAQQAAAPAWSLNPTPAELLAEREADPVYRLGFVRGHRKGCADTERQYQTLTSLYAQYAVLVPPPGYQPDPLLTRLKTWLAARLMSGPRLPLATRRLLFHATPTTPPADAA